MKKISFHPSVLQITYLIIFSILFALIIYTPSLINGPAYLTKRLIIEEETFEGVLLGILLLLSVLIINLYKNEVYKHQEQIKKINHDKKKIEERLNDADKYIGLINVQIQEINSIFNNVNKYPENKNELKKTFRYFSDRVLGIVNTNWVLFRIINLNSQKTIFEHFEARRNFSGNYPRVSNKLIIDKQPVTPFTSVISSPQNLNILVFCIVPVDKIDNDQRVFVQAIINEITKLFVIVNSSYYKKGKEIFIESKTGKHSTN
jgi:hypothetical protein